MVRLFFFVGTILSLLFGLASLGQNLEKVKVGSAIREMPVYYLVIAAADEKGYWKDNGLEAEWTPFKGGVAFYQALAARAIGIGMGPVISMFQAASRGVPLVVVSNLQTSHNFFFWVRTDSRFKKPGDLAGARIGVARLGGAEHAYGRMVAKSIGVDDQVKFLGTGGITESLGALKAGRIDGVVLTPAQMLDLKLKGEVHEFLSVQDYRAKEWAAHVVLAHKRFVADQPDLVRRVVRAVLAATRFFVQNPDWAISQTVKFSGVSPQAARIIFDEYKFVPDGKIDLKGMENVMAFLTEYGIIAKEKAPAVKELVTSEFIPSS